MTDSANGVQLLQSGQYDGGSFSGDATLRLISGGDVAPVNTDLIPNYADVFPGLKGQPHNTVDGVPYGPRMAAARTSSCTTRTPSRRLPPTGIPSGMPIRPPRATSASTTPRSSSPMLLFD